MAGICSDGSTNSSIVSSNDCPKARFKLWTPKMESNFLMKKFTKRLSFTSTLSDAFSTVEEESTSRDTDSSSSSSERKTVKFGSIEVRQYEIITSDHPGCSAYFPLSLGWRYAENYPIAIDQYEENRSSRRSKADLRQSCEERRNMLAGSYWQVDQCLQLFEVALVYVMILIMGLSIGWTPITLQFWGVLLLLFRSICSPITEEENNPEKCKTRRTEAYCTWHENDVHHRNGKHYFRTHSQCRRYQRRWQGKPSKQAERCKAVFFPKPYSAVALVRILLVFWRINVASSWADHTSKNQKMKIYNSHEQHGFELSSTRPNFFWFYCHLQIDWLLNWIRIWRSHVFDLLARRRIDSIRMWEKVTQ